MSPLSFFEDKGDFPPGATGRSPANQEWAIELVPGRLAGASAEPPTDLEWRFAECEVRSPAELLTCVLFLPSSQRLLR